MIEPELCCRVEEINPTDRVRGTVVNVTNSIFVIKYDNGDYVAYTLESWEAFQDASNKPVPGHAAELIHHLREKHGIIPPEDVAGTPQGNIPSPRKKSHIRDAGETLTGADEPPTI